MAEIQKKPHYFELVMNSVSTNEDGEYELNQECIVFREYAKTGGELTLKQMTFTKDAYADIAKVCVDAMDKQSAWWQAQGVAEQEAVMAAMSKVPPGKPQ